MGETISSFTTDSGYKLPSDCSNLVIQLLLTIIGQDISLLNFKENMLKNREFNISDVFNQELDKQKKGCFGKSSLKHYMVARWQDVSEQLVLNFQKHIGLEFSSYDVVKDKLNVQNIISWFNSNADGKDKQAKKVTYSQFIDQMME